MHHPPTGHSELLPEEVAGASVSGNAGGGTEDIISDVRCVDRALSLSLCVVLCCACASAPAHTRPLHALTNSPVHPSCRREGTLDDVESSFATQEVDVESYLDFNQATQRYELRPIPSEVTRARRVCVCA